MTADIIVCPRCKMANAPGTKKCINCKKAL